MNSRTLESTHRPPGSPILTLGWILILFNVLPAPAQTVAPPETPAGQALASWLVRADISAAHTPPVPDNPLRAQTSLGFNPKTRCPDLRMADEGTLTVVVFWLPRSGIPSQISVRSSSGSTALDAAAINCVSKLRFAPDTRLGDGEPIDSWQQIALRWAAGPAPEPVAGTPARTTADAQQNHSEGQPNSVTVHVCVDQTGKLNQEPTIVRSSGKASLDQAALKIAASGSPFYRPDTAPNGPPVSGCAQLAIQFETK